MGRPGTKQQRHRRHVAANPKELLESFDTTYPEQSYVACVPAEHRRRFGQFFTPPTIARLLCEWIATIRPRTALDPAAGTGILLRHLLALQPDCRITAVEIDPVAASALRTALPNRASVTIEVHDFLTWEDERTFDAIVANPPYLRHHDLNYAFDIFQRVGARSGVSLTRLTNAYALFLLEICRRLSPGGRAAVILPSEWLNANFGQPLKQLLVEQQLIRYLICLDRDVFSDALTTSCLLLLEKPRKRAADWTLKSLHVRTSAELASLRDLIHHHAQPSSQIVAQQLRPHQLPVHAKWTPLIERVTAETESGFIPLSHLADTSRGIATGANHFFHLSESDWAAAHLSPTCRRACVGRALDVAGLIFDQREHEQLVARGRRAWLLDAELDLTPAVRAYLKQGESAGLPERYLLAARQPWYRIERRAPAPIWAAVFGRRGLRFVWNQAAVLHLTTFHGIYPRDNRVVAVQALTAVLNSPLIQERARQQQRIYGGGLRKFEPRDLLDLQVPDLSRAPDDLLEQLAAQLTILHQAHGNASNSSNSVYQTIDQLVLDAARLASRSD